MNITPRIKSARNRNNLIVNVSIEIPLKTKMPISHRSQETSLSPSPNKRKRCKLISSTQIEKKIANINTVREPANTVREMPMTQYEHPPSRKKYSNNPTPTTNANLSSKATFSKFRSCDLSPKKRLCGKKGKNNAKIRNISILEQVINEDDNIIKYTSNSNELKDKAEDVLLQSLGRKMETHISQIDLAEVRRIENSTRDSREKLYIKRRNDILRTACAKKIQRAWRNYKTKKLIRCYSNDIRNKYLRNINISDEKGFTSRSQPTGLKFKKKLLAYDQIIAAEAKSKNIQPQLQTQHQPQPRPQHQPQPQSMPHLHSEQQQSERSEHELEIGQKTDRSSKIVKKIQEDNLQKWQGLLAQIKNKKNISEVLQFSIQRSKQLKREIDSDSLKSQSPPQLDEADEKIIKTKKYYDGERQRWRDNIQRSNGSIKREERVNYFENQMLRLENDYSDSVSSLSNSAEIQYTKHQEEIENLKLRKKLEVFRNHLPEVPPFHPQPDKERETKSQQVGNRVDIATIMRKKNEQKEKQHIMEKVEEEVPKPDISKAKPIEFLEFDINEDPLDKLSSSSSQSIIDTHRQWRPLLQVEEKHEEIHEWKMRLSQTLKKQQTDLFHLILQQFILEALIEVSESQKLIAFIKGIYEQSKAISRKAEGIVTNHTSIKDYISYFINYLMEYNIDSKLYKNLLIPAGPSPIDVLRYFRGQQTSYDPDSEHIMNIKIFEQHWEYANQLIYFDKKWDDEEKEADRVIRLKALTRIFFRAIFDCFNEALECQRIYGRRGKPYTWSQQKLKVEIPDLKKCLTLAYQKVLKCSLVFAGVLFKDKHHNLDPITMQEIQQTNIVKLITSELQDQQPLWMFVEDQLAEVKLQLSLYVEQVLLKEVAALIGLKLTMGFR